MMVHDLVDKYNESGYVVLRNFFSDVEISLFDDHVDRIFRQWMKDHKSEIFNHRLVNMHSLTCSEYFEGASEKRVEFFKVIASSKLTNTIEEIFGSDFHFHNTQFFFNPSNKARLPYWHRDLQYSPVDDLIQCNEQKNMLSLHVRIPLVEEQGVEIIPGSHKRWDTKLEHDVRLEMNGHINNEALPNAVLTSLVPGDILIFNAQMIHRGNYDLNASRKALDLCVGTYHPLTSEYLDERVLPSEEELGRITNNRWYSRAREIVAKKSKC